MTSEWTLTPYGYWCRIPDWEQRDMTVCIAAICDQNDKSGRKVVLGSDRKISSALGSAETTLKSRTLGVTSWRCLTAGTDNDILTTVRLLQNEFRKNKARIDETNILSIIRGALNERKKDKANELINGKLGISYREFLENGKSRLPEDIFRSITTEVERTIIDAEFIIVGFSAGFPLLVKTDSRCGAVLKEHFAVAGEGAYLAQASLLSRAHYHLEPLGRTLYSVFEAKKFAQGAPSVGTSTSITVMYEDGRHELLTAKGVAFLEEQYRKHGPRELPSDFDTQKEFFTKLKILPPEPANEESP